MEYNFHDFMKTLKRSIKTWDYFVNWHKVFHNSAELEIILHKWNYLVGKENFKEEFQRLYDHSPDIVKALPVLLAARESKLEILSLDDGSVESFDFHNTENCTFEKYYTFVEKSGLSQIFQKEGVKNIVDYVIGVEVGLDSNGRKNRGGRLMEKIVETFIQEFCQRRGFVYIAQARATDIRSKWGFEIAVDKSERSFDFAIYNPENKCMKLVEANFYNGGGSKLKSVCGEFRNLFDILQKQGIDFIWITDGDGWRSAHKPLEEAYNHMSHIFNLSMLEKNILQQLKW